MYTCFEGAYDIYEYIQCKISPFPTECALVSYISIFIITKYTDCVPQCKFGDCNTTIGKCICPPGHSGADCSVIGVLLLLCFE